MAVKKAAVKKTTTRKRAAEVELDQDGDIALDIQEGKRGMMKVVCGVHTLDIPAQGQSVAGLRAELTQPLNIHKDAVALVNGEQVGDEDRYHVQVDDQVEFIREAGQKG